MTAAHLAQDCAPQNHLLGVAPWYEGHDVSLTVGQHLVVDGTTVWFPTTSVVRVEVGKPRVLSGWIDRTGAVGLMESLNGPSDGLSWIVTAPGSAIAVSAAYVHSLLDRSPAFGRAVMCWLHQSLADAQWFGVSSVQDPAIVKVARLLLKLNEAHGSRTNFDISQAEIAGLLHLQRTTVCGVMLDLKRRSLIKYLRSSIAVTDAFGLRALTEANY